MRTSSRHIAFLLALSLAGLSACGGGGGGGGGDGAVRPAPQPPPPRPPQPTLTPDQPAYYETSEYNLVYSDVLPGITPLGHRADNHLTLIKASAAYARGATGQGEVITVIDTGARQNHRELAGQVVRSTAEINYVPDNAQRSHGTGVAAVIAARRHGDGRRRADIHGVAFNARINMFAIRLGTASAVYSPFDITSYDSGFDASLAAQFRNYLAQADAASSAIINFSFGLSGAINLYSSADVRARARQYPAVLAQASTPAADRKIIVWAAGNERNRRDRNGRPIAAASPIFLGGIGAWFPELQGHVLAVVAVDQTGAIASFSNYCGIAKSFCLAAPGQNIIIPDSTSTSGYRTASGTSFSAPIVSGGLALLRQHYRGQLGNTELVARMLATANKTGRYANSDIYGQGLLDLDAATRPVGTTSLSAGRDINAPRYASASSALVLAPAFGNALGKALQGREIAAFDTLNAPFFLPLADFFLPHRQSTDDTWWRLAAQQRQSEQRSLPDGSWFAPGQDSAFSLTRQTAGGRAFLSHRAHPGLHFGLHRVTLTGENPGQAVLAQTGRPSTSTALLLTGRDAGREAAPWLALAQEGLSFGAERRLGPGTLRGAVFSGRAIWNGQRDADTSRAQGVLGEYQWLARRGSASLQLGWLGEDERVLGTRALGAFGALGSHTWFGGITAHWQASRRWAGFAALHLGLTEPQQQQPERLLLEMSSLWSTSFSIGLVGQGLWREDERVLLCLTQPQRVESGSARLRYARGRTPYGALVLEDAGLSLAPDSRQLDLSLAWQRPLGSGTLWLEGTVSRHPGHDSQAGTATSALLHYSLRF